MSSMSLSKEGRIVRFLARDGVRLNGILFGKGSGDCVIFVHGMESSLFTNTSFAFASASRRGSAFFTFNNRGNGSVSSFRKMTGRKKTRIIAGTYLERFEDSVYDIEGAIDAMRRLGFRNFILCGHSTGCQKVMYYQYRKRDRRIKALVLLGPCDDYNMHRKRLGRKYAKVSGLCRRLAGERKGNIFIGDASGFSAQRLDSVLNLGRVEARLLNYDGPLKEFGALTVPILAVFGSDEENVVKPVRKYLEILDIRSSSRRFRGLMIDGANHSFENREAELVGRVNEWIDEL